MRSVASYLPDEDTSRYSATSRDYRSQLPVSLLSSYKYCRPMICTAAGECITAGGKIPNVQALLWKQCQHRDIPTSFQEKVAYLYEFSKAFLKLLLRISETEFTRPSLVFNPVRLTFPSESVEMILISFKNDFRLTYRIHEKGECDLYYPGASSSMRPYLTLLKDGYKEYTYKEQRPMKPPSPDAESVVNVLLSNEFHTGQPKTLIQGTLELRDFMYRKITKEIYLRYI